MKGKKKAWFLVSLLLLIALISVSVASGQDREQRLIASLSVTDASIEFQPQVEYAQLILTVSGANGFDSRQVFETGTTPTFLLSDEAGNPLADGQYSYELLVVPVLSFETQQALASVREADAETRAALEQELIAAGALPAEVQIQSGSFYIEGNAAITGSEDEIEGEPLGTNLPPGLGSTQVIDAPTDQVILDDLIVDGSACIGMDCVSGESFGFDTIRVKENNLRIHFQDTSSSASFPTNDWRIIINDSSNGGANYFGIEDSNTARIPFRVEAGAPANSLYVEDSGQIGVGTSTPVVEMHVTDGDTPTVRLEQNGSSGWSPQTWDVAGNETNFFIRDVTNGSELPFRIRPGAPSNSIFIDTDGDVGLGTSSPSAALDVIGTDGTTQIRVDENSAITANRVLFELENNGASQFNIINSNTGDSWQFSVDSNGDFIVSLIGTGGSEFKIGGDGSVKMGPAGTDNFFLNAAGNLTVAGTVTANGTVLSSVPNSSVDATLVSSLRAKISGQESEIEALQQENAQLEERLATLELLVQSLIESQD